VEDHALLRLNLDGFDLEDLRSNLDDSLIWVDQGKPEEAYGEPITIAVIVLAPIAIKALATWMTKQRRRTEFSYDIEIQDPGGQRVHQHLDIKTSSSTTEPEVVRQLVTGLNLDPKLVNAVTALGK
jgi:hypothetical protein